MNYFQYTPDYDSQFPRDDDGKLICIEADYLDTWKVTSLTKKNVVNFYISDFSTVQRHHIIWFDWLH